MVRSCRALAPALFPALCASLTRGIGKYKTITTYCVKDGLVPAFHS